jgi:hypothetical protein
MREMDGSRRSVSTVLTIIVLVVCIIGVLVLPQVGLPDFVPNGSKSFAMALAHGATVFLASVSGPFVALHARRRSSQDSRPIPSAQATGRLLAAGTPLPLRC